MHSHGDDSFHQDCAHTTCNGYKGIKQKMKFLDYSGAPAAQICSILRGAQSDAIFCIDDVHVLDELVWTSTFDALLEDSANLCGCIMCCQILILCNVWPFRAPSLPLVLRLLFSDIICSEAWVLYKFKSFED